MYKINNDVVCALRGIFCQKTKTTKRKRPDVLLRLVRIQNEMRNRHLTYVDRMEFYFKTHVLIYIYKIKYDTN